MKSRTPAYRKNRSAFARRLEGLRRDCGYQTQEDFAKLLGVEGERYRRWERGETEPNIDMMTRISMLTGACLNILITGIDPIYDETEQKNLKRRKPS